ncbi:autotransporter outer membrane beta-barrel domain-containing protein [Bordetella petrii]|uniref:autotransporter outer membrane beta-barrel domain-containing protein n=1 Tax=Bordetella petrii TaxID=94624 RepID=UPI001E362A52|nr:autotransporter outer membrane beta-barrel domain-containing protein [Bordetella petrii]MCD0504891.1 autotransporter outer membrane beta-barrel domain-containing protein [Bordetella petrii]
MGGTGGKGGDGGDIYTRLSASSIHTHGPDAPDSGNDTGNGGQTDGDGNKVSDASAVVAQSIGGGGGSGGSVKDQSAAVGVIFTEIGTAAVWENLVMVGGQGGNGGDGGKVDTAIWDSDVGTEGQYSHGVYAQSVGGGGGDGGSASTFSLDAVIGLQSINVQDEAAVGGRCITSDDGDNSCAGGTGGEVNVNLGDGDDAGWTVVRTSGDYSNGVLAQSIGGGGGDGGSADAYAFDFETGAAISVDALVSVGAKGGKGGDGGAVKVATLDDTRIKTTGSGARGIVAQSIGGGGGTGQGTAVFLGLEGQVTKALEAGFSVDVGVGMSGGEGGNAGQATVNNFGDIVTTGRDSDGVLVQSIGGGGGVGGSMGADEGDILDNVFNAIKALLDHNPFALNGSITVNVGGKGGTGGDGANATLHQYGAVSTSGDYADGVVVQSIGGGGGVGGGSYSQNYEDWLDLNIAVGGKGGTGGHGGQASVTLERSALVQTQGYGAYGVLAQSIGGGGGQGGSGTLATKGRLEIGAGVGGTGGDGNDGGTVMFASDSGNRIQTFGDTAHAIALQSIGGGGGTGGLTQGVGGTRIGNSLNFTVSVGGSGGDGGDGGVVDMCSSVACRPVDIYTGGHMASGLVAQSIGGGGGIGSVGSPDQTPGLANSFSLDLLLGGAGGDGGDGGAVNIGGEHNITTRGDFSHGMVAQSLGGGGGMAGVNDPLGLDFNFTPPSPELQLVVTLGSLADGHAGDGGVVDVASRGDIVTLGDGSHALVAQSIGGGGGMMGAVLKDDDDSDAPDAWPDDVEIERSLALGAGGDDVGTLAGSSGDAADGGSDAGSSAPVVRVSHDGTLATSGTWAMGVLAQSIGGGGGVGHAGLAVDGTLDNGAANIQVGSLGRTGAAGGVTVDVTRQGGKLLTTTGAGAYGVLAQSISQGGGLGTGMVADSAALIQVGGGSDTVKVASGEAAGDVSVNVHTNVLTWGDDATAIAAQSIGGGGGVGGVQALEGTRLDGARLLVGGYMAGEAGAVSVASDWTVNTAGDGAHGVVAQSIGGGGGIGIIGVTDSASQDGTTVVIGGYDPGDEGVDTGDNGAGRIDLDLDGVISTGGAGADGVVAQAIGGGGGLGGAPGSTASGPIADAANAPYDVSLLVGGSAGIGAGGTIGSADNYARLAARVTTYGDFADAVLLQSIGSGGGQGGASASGPGPISLDLRVGGNSKPSTATSADQSGGGAIALEFDSTGDNNAAFTHGHGANAVLVQSIGGGGGVAQSAAAGGTGTVRVGGINGAWGSGGHIQVSPSSWVRASTEGQSAHGLVLQSIGGGGGLATVYGGDPATGAAGQFGLVLGAGQAGSGNGGKVDLTTGGELTTKGDGSIAVIAQSVGGGGGIVSAGDAAAVSSIDLGGDIDVQGNGGEVSVALTGGTVTTEGAGAHGVVAQSVGGGGGIAGGLGQAISLDRDGWAKTSGQVSGTGADVAVVIQNTVTTTGANAHGVIAQSIGGGGGLAGSAQGGFAGSVNAVDGNTENWAGHVDVTVDGSVSATGDGSTGVFAQSEGSDEKGFPVAVTVNGTVAGGSGSGTGVWMASNGVGASLLEIGTDGGVTALSGIALRYDGEAGMNVRNSGLMDGGTQCDNPGVCAIENMSTGTLTGATLYQANVANAGTLVVGSAGRFGRLTVAGDYSQASSGVLRADIDFAGMRAAHMTVQGDARLDGQFDLAAISLLPGRELAVLDVEGASAGVLQAKDSPIFDFDMRQVGKQQRVSVKGADFNAASQNLASNQRAVAGHLQEIWDQGGTVEMAPLFAVLNTAANQGPGAYRERLADLSPGVTLAPGAQMVADMARFAGSMMSCPAMQRTGTDGLEQDCFWGQVSRRSTDQDAAGGTSGYAFDSTTYQVGGQREIRPGWFVGGSVAYQNNSLRADNGRASGSGDAGYAGVVLKHQAGPWVYSAALGGGYGSYDLDRSLGVDGYDRRAGSSPDVYSAGMRLRVSRHIGVTDQFYLKPYVDLDALYARMPGYTESGGPLSLEVDSSDQFVASLSPMLEIGGRVDLPQGATMRPYAYAGASFLSDDSWSTHARFKGAPAGSSGFSTSLPGDHVVGRFGLGMQVNNRSGLDFRLQYDGEVSSKTTSHAGHLKVMYRF